MLDINISACRTRQRRLISAMQAQQIELVIVTQIEHVQWLAGPRFPWTMSPAAALTAAGHLTLICPQKESATAAADDIRTYEAKWLSTLRNDQRAACSEVLLSALADSTARRIGLEFSSCSHHITRPLMARKPNIEFVDLEPELYRLRRRKDPDELARIKRAISGTARMYEKAREIIAPGITELEVFNQLQAAANAEFGEMMTGTGNDYQCNARGGPARTRAAQAGELYILDLGPAFRGYFADNARTIAVTRANDDQVLAWEHVAAVFSHIASRVKPGVSCREVFHEVQAMLDACPVGVFNHHLGHGIGLFPHEAPHLNPNWDDHFELGDVFAAEPGLYDPELLRAGIRIENNYVVTNDGVELLTNFPLNL